MKITIDRKSRYYSKETSAHVGDAQMTSKVTLSTMTDFTRATKNSELKPFVEKKDIECIAFWDPTESNNMKKLVCKYEDIKQFIFRSPFNLFSIGEDVLVDMFVGRFKDDNYDSDIHSIENVDLNCQVYGKGDTYQAPSGTYDSTEVYDWFLSGYFELGGATVVDSLVEFNMFNEVKPTRYADNVALTLDVYLPVVNINNESIFAMSSLQDVIASIKLT